MSDIEVLRREKINELYTKIKSLQVSNQRSEETVERLRHGVFDKEYSKKKIETLRETIHNNNDRIEKCQSDIQKTRNGDYDDDILSIVESEDQQFHSKRNSYNNKKEKRKEEKNEQNQKLQNYFQNIRDNRRSERRRKYNMDKEYYYYVKNSNRLPGYMKKNLKKMSNNKGYRWNNIIFFGDKPCKTYTNDSVIFEKDRKNTLYIHEWKGNTTTLYKKERDQPNELISSHTSQLRLPF